MSKLETLCAFLMAFNGAVFMLRGSLPGAEAAADPQAAIVTYCTPYESAQAEQKLLDLVAHAKRTIRVCAYGFTDPALCDALIDAHKRGVDVAVVMDKTQAAGAHQKQLLAKLRRNSISVAVGKSEVHSQLIHAKFIVVDDLYVESGSLNYSGSGLEQDNFIDIIKSKDRAKKFTQFWDRIYGHILGIQCNHMGHIYLSAPVDLSNAVTVQ